jgi:hypothetical protein
VFNGIRIGVGGVSASSVQGNSIANIDFHSFPNFQGTLVFTGIFVSSGSVNVGNLTGNTIGSTSDTGSIRISIDSSGNSPAVQLIAFRGTAGTIRNNLIGGIVVGGVNDRTPVVSGIATNSSVSSTFSISENTLGSATVANSLVGTTSVFGLQIIGISSGGSAATEIANNTVANIAIASTTMTATVRGIVHSGSGIGSISTNLIRDLSSASSDSSSGTGTAVNGIVYSGPSGLGASIAGNTVSALSATNSGTSPTVAVGIVVANSSSTVVSKNKVYDIRNASTAPSTPAVAAGILFRSASVACELSNNTISLGTGQSTNTAFIGVWNNLRSTGTLSLYYNSVALRGAPKTGSATTFALLRGELVSTSFDVTTPVVARNNVLANQRTNDSVATAKHYAVGNTADTLTTNGWTSTASNFNALVSTNPATLALWAAADKSVAAYKTISGGEQNSVTGNPTFIAPETGDLHISLATPTQLESGGTPVGGQTIDFDGAARNSSTPDIGADEFEGIRTAKILSLTVLLEGFYNPSAPPPIRGGEDGLSKRAAPQPPVSSDAGIRYQQFLEAKRNAELLRASVAAGSTLRDTVRVYLRNTTNPYVIVDTAQSYFSANGDALMGFTHILNNASYYVAVVHRNSIETWSAAGQTFLDDSLRYDFTTAASKAYGNNLILRGTKYCLFGGDTNRDGVVDGSDLGGCDNDVTNFLVGYVASDVNGDGVVDGSDLALLDNNATNFVQAIHP